MAQTLAWGREQVFFFLICSIQSSISYNVIKQRRAGTALGKSFPAAQLPSFGTAHKHLQTYATWCIIGNLCRSASWVGCWRSG